MEKYLLLGSAIFFIGVYGVLARRNILVILMSVELMLNGANLNLVAFSRIHGDVNGHVFFIMIMGVAAAEVAVGLALLIALFRNKQTVNTSDLNILKG